MINTKFLSVLVVVTPILLVNGGCATMSGVEKQQATIVLRKCPVLKEYSKEQLKQAASEVKNLPDKSQVAEMVIDYSKLRAACRVATKKLKSKYN